MSHEHQALELKKKKKQPKTHLCENADTIQTKPYCSFLIVNYYIN